MYSQFNNIKISREFIHITFTHPKTNEVLIVFNTPQPIVWSHWELQTWLGTSGEKFKLDNFWLTIDIPNGECIKIYTPKDFRDTIEKSLKHNGLFDLNYRKHLRAQFSKKHIDVFFMDNINDEFATDPQFKEYVESLKLTAEDYSFGVNSKPTLVIAPPWEGEKKLSYIIIKDSKPMLSGVM